MTILLINASNIKCSGCAERITEELSVMAGVGHVEADIESGQISIEGEAVDDAVIRQALASLGYPAIEEQENKSGNEL